jgi:DNA-binding SARP family transcriptional activator/tetratricopeptide (TPR) repeat protein
MYGVLGELRVGPEPDFEPLPGGLTLILLAVLLMNPNQLLRKEDLIRTVWGTDIAETQLQKRVGEIRTLLAAIGRREDLITHPQRGYELRVRDEDLDSLWFLRLLNEAGQAREQQDTAAELARLKEALRLWRGARPVSNVVAEVFRPETDLERRRKRAALRMVELEFADGRYRRVLDDLIQLTADYPTDGPLCRQLMIAYYRSGHDGDALAAYERYKHALAEERAGEPDPELRTLHYAIARGDLAAVAGAIGGGSAPAVVPRQLPAAVGLVGRDDLLAEMEWLLRRRPDRAVRVIVVSGPGGIGKTALAVRAAQEVRADYPHGQIFLRLRTANGEPVDTGELLAQVLRAFELPRIPDSTQERRGAYQSLLAGRRVLVVLDDAVDEAQVEELVPADPDSAVIVTARQRLPDLADSHHVAPLAPLDPSAATELFRRIVGDATIELPGAESEGVDRVIGLCGGLPLAIRVAAALRVRDHPRSTAELADRLARQGPAGFEYGARSVARTIGAGYDRLDAGARRLFLGFGLSRLPDFRPWTAAAMLAGGGVDPDAALSALAAAFLLESSDSQASYGLHTLTREYARRRGEVELGDDAGTMPAQAYRALLALVRRAHASLYGGDYEVVHSDVPDWAGAPAQLLDEIAAAPMAWFETERANVRAAVEHSAALGLVETAWDLAVSAHEFYTIGGYVDDWYATHTRALRACRAAGDRRGEGILLACLGQPALAAAHRGDGVPGSQELERAVALLAACGDRHGEGIALRTLANALRRSGQLSRPLELFTRALRAYEDSGDPVGRCQTLRFIGQTYLDLAAYPDALRMLEAAAEVAVSLGWPRLVAQGRYWLGEARLAVGELAAARAAFLEVLDVFRDGGGVGRAYAEHGLGELAIAEGSYDEAADRLAAAAVHCRDADQVLEGRVDLSLAALHRALGQPDRERDALASAIAHFTACGAAHLQARALALVGDWYAQHGDEARADLAWHEVTELYDLGGVPAEDRIIRRPGPGR